MILGFGNRAKEFRSFTPENPSKLQSFKHVLPWLVCWRSDSALQEHTRLHVALHHAHRAALIRRQTQSSCPTRPARTHRF